MLVTYSLLFWEKNSMRLMVLNNLKAHSMRNKLTTSIFSITLAFNIFTMVQFRLIIMQGKENALMKRGNYPCVQASFQG